MAKCSLLSVLVLLATASNMALARRRPRPPGRIVEHLSMNILNNTPWAWGNLVVHCKSDNSDFGVQYVEAAHWYNFDFWTNQSSTKYITCSIASGYGKHNQNFITFQDVGFFGNEPRHRSNCVWVVREDGFYRSENLTQQPSVKINDWKQHRKQKRLSDRSG